MIKSVSQLPISESSESEQKQRSSKIKNEEIKPRISITRGSDLIEALKENPNGIDDLKDYAFVIL